LRTAANSVSALRPLLIPVIANQNRPARGAARESCLADALYRQHHQRRRDVADQAGPERAWPDSSPSLTTGGTTPRTARRQAAAAAPSSASGRDRAGGSR
jgi:hypothetical protein